jgi:tetratricopeptide (TPR) repeat protein
MMKEWKVSIKALAIQPNPYGYASKAYGYLLLNQIDLAIENLSYAIQIDPNFKEAIAQDSDFDTIRNDPRFQALLSI